MTDRITEASPRLYARIAGGLYLIVIVGGIFAEIFVRGRLVVHGDAAATAHNILAHELLYRLGFAVEVFYCACFALFLAPGPLLAIEGLGYVPRWKEQAIAAHEW
jgi:hypothetical protein